MTIKVSDSSGGGNYFKPDDGMYVLEFVDREETTQRAFQSEAEEPAWRWSFLVFDFPSKNPVIDSETGAQAVYKDRTKQSLHIRSKAYPRLAALLKRDPEVGETDDALFPSAVGKRCLGTFNKGWLKTTVRMPEGM